MSASVTIEEVAGASVTIGTNGPTQIELNGGESAVTIEQSGTNVFIGGQGSGGITWDAPSAQAVWMIPHNLGRHPIVSIRDSSGAVVLADVQHLDPNVLTITFSQPVLGSADLA